MVSVLFLLMLFRTLFAVPTIPAARSVSPSTASLAPSNACFPDAAVKGTVTNKAASSTVRTTVPLSAS